MTVCSPTTLMGWGSSIFRLSTVCPCAPRLSATSWEVMEPKSLPSSPAFRVKVRAMADRVAAAATAVFFSAVRRTVRALVSASIR